MFRVGLCIGTMVWFGDRARTRLRTCTRDEAKVSLGLGLELRLGLKLILVIGTKLQLYTDLWSGLAFSARAETEGSIQFMSGLGLTLRIGLGLGLRLGIMSALRSSL